MRTRGEVVNGDPRVIVEIGFVIGRGCLDRGAPSGAVIVGTRYRHLLTADLVAERIRQAGVIDGHATADAERTIAAGWTPVEAGIAAGRPPDRVKARQVAAGPGLAIVRGHVVGGCRSSRRERA